MARRRRKKYYYNSNRNPRRGYDEDYQPIGLDLSPETKRGIAVVVFILIAVLSGLGIFGLAGDFGQLISKILRLIFGTAAYVTPLFFLGVALSLFLGIKLHKADDPEEKTAPTSFARTYLGASLFIVAITGILHLVELNHQQASAFELVKAGQGGGYLGVFTSFPLYLLMGFKASVVVLVALVVISVLIAFDISLHGIFRATGILFSKGLGLFRSQENTNQVGREIPNAPNAAGVKINTMENSGFAVNKVEAKTPAKHALDDELEEVTIRNPTLENHAQSSAKAALDIIPTPAKYQKGKWQLPPTDLLEETKTEVQSGNIEANVKIIKKTLDDFGVVVEMGEVNVGPTVTQYTFRPAVGVKISQISALQNDLALALAASSIRIEAPIPGKSLVGVEVPNKTTALVRLKDLLESNASVEHISNLAFALGRDVSGHPIITDLARMPHLLIAGATGTGKSVCINTIMTSFLYRNSPEELRFIVIDPKRVELTLYNGIPHLLTPVVTDHRQAVNALRWTVVEMDRRYKVLSEAGKRNIDEYNHSSKTRIPYIVVVVDELADLMAVAKSDVEAAIVRLAQMARAVGLHLLLATQRPSVNIITGLIKANITSRVAFAVASQVDSRTILDMAGAEDLLGNGDMLYTAANLPKPKRIQAPYISEKEVRKVVEYIKNQSGPVDYQEEILEKPPRNTNGFVGGDDDDEADDDMINAAIEEIQRARRASASLLQRRLKVGYARAARILDILEERGMIGPSDGAKPREIYMETNSSPEAGYDN